MGARLASLLLLGALLFAGATATLLPHVPGADGAGPGSEFNVFERLVLTHRHGARTPIKPVSGICGNTPEALSAGLLACGQLNAQGAGMLRALGVSVRAAYPGLVDSGYTYERVAVLSDTSNRVVQSALAFLHGLYNHTIRSNGWFGGREAPPTRAPPAEQMKRVHPTTPLRTVPVPPTVYRDDAGFLPIVDTSFAKAIDGWYYVPAYALHAPFLEQRVRALMTIKAAEQFSNTSTGAMELLLQMAVEINLQVPECRYVLFAMYECLDLIKDFAFSAHAMGILDNYPTVAANFRKIDVWRTQMTNLMEANGGDPGWFDTYGWPGAYIWNDMMDSAAGRRTLGDHYEVVGEGELSPTLVEYSAHDTTLNTFFAATGNTSYAYPVFGAAVVLEVWSRNGTATRASNRAVPRDAIPVTGGAEEEKDLFVRPLYGFPNHTPSTSRDPNSGIYAYEWQRYAITCQAANGTLYRTDAGCPLSDWRRFAVTRSSNDPCLADPKDLLAADCDPTVNRGPPVAGSPCATFRRQCALTACGPGQYTRPDLGCASVN